MHQLKSESTNMNPSLKQLLDAYPKLVPEQEQSHIDTIKKLAQFPQDRIINLKHALDRHMIAPEEFTTALKSNDYITNIKDVLSQNGTTAMKKGLLTFSDAIKLNSIKLHEVISDKGIMVMERNNLTSRKIIADASAMAKFTENYQIAMGIIKPKAA